jgi:2-polyprenyl-3-methyl-5-hydroxy-6-metoxy-1,4-benzoquinol methylase
MITLKKTKSLTTIAHEWDAIAALRDEQVCSGKDHSANLVLAPAILKELVDVKTLIDIGCGTGWLTHRAKRFTEFAVGIDPSKESIAVARARHNDSNITYYAQCIESFAGKSREFDTAISNMAVSSAPDLHAFVLAARNILRSGAMFIFTIPHPFFWPIYWGYASHPSFDYRKTCAVEGEFKIQSESTTLLTTHFHHPLEQYVAALTAGRFRIEAMEELTGKGFRLPRFMLIKAFAI